MNQILFIISSFDSRPHIIWEAHVIYNILFLRIILGSANDAHKSLVCTDQPRLGQHQEFLLLNQLFHFLLLLLFHIHYIDDIILHQLCGGCLPQVVFIFLSVFALSRECSKLQLFRSWNIRIELVLTWLIPIIVRVSTTAAAASCLGRTVGHPKMLQGIIRRLRQSNGHDPVDFSRADELANGRLYCRRCHMGIYDYVYVLFYRVCWFWGRCTHLLVFD